MSHDSDNVLISSCSLLVCQMYEVDTALTDSKSSLRCDVACRPIISVPLIKSGVRLANILHTANSLTFSESAVSRL